MRRNALLLTVYMRCTRSAHDAGQMTSVGSHNGFSYESITASEQSRLHMGNVYHYTNINYCNALFPDSPRLQ